MLAGGQAPYVLRLENSQEPLEGEEDSRKCYGILGDAYIRGVMNGEVLQKLEERGGEMEKIVLV